MSWNDESAFQNVYELFQKLLELQKTHRYLACRGQSDRDWLLQPTFDRAFGTDTDYQTRLAEEAALITKFQDAAKEHVGENEKSLLGEKMGALGVLRHHGAPTRLLDWTCSPWVGLYFAAIDRHEKDGAMWWFDQEAFEAEVHRRWDEVYHMERDPRTKEVKLAEYAFKSDADPWITKYHYRLWFPRLEAQQGFFTLAGRLGCDHADAIENVFRDVENGRSKFGRLIVPGGLKAKVLAGLRAMNIHSKSLDYPGADIVGRSIAAQFGSRDPDGGLA